ncbi:MAG: Histidine--tRNA ligase [Gemmatimonadaceae bacterium]|nr:Histidine--tRNA ligase [Gemmatimonadaceae bacterium]
MSTAALPGFREFYPEDMALRSWLFDRWRDVARRFAFVEYDGPPLEPLDLYTKKSGDEIVDQLYAFEDKGGRAVALRPEMTPTVARMVAARAQALRKPVRWFSIPQLFRYERQQRGRLREHFQLNVDLFGESDVAADAELLAVACEIMRACGLSADDVRARVSDRRILSALLEGLGVPSPLLGVAYAAIDKIDREPWDGLVARMSAAGIPADVARECLSFTKDSSLDRVRQRLSTAGRAVEFMERMERYEELLVAHGVQDYFTFDLTIVRGLTYYTGIVFELFDVRGDFRAICGGGRYDNLLRDLGGVDLPALGFGMGDVVLSELLKARGRAPDVGSGVDIWVVADEGTGWREVIEATAALRRMGLSADYVLSAEKLASQKSNKQLDVARKARARYALLLSREESATLRSLTDAGANERTRVAAWLHASSAQEFLEATGDEADGLRALLRSRVTGGGTTDRPRG